MKTVRNAENRCETRKAEKTNAGDMKNTLTAIFQRDELFLDEAKVLLYYGGCSG